MKTQQRNFIVEIKSSGRRTAIRQGSIWGNTDLKAMALQAASVAPQLFDAPKQAEAIVETDTAPIQDVAVLISNEPGLEIQQPIALEQPSLPVDEQARIEAETETFVVPASAPATKSARKRVRKNLREAAISTVPVPADRPIDALAELEAENRRLKAALVNHLRLQNSQLRSMLERFNAS